MEAILFERSSQFRELIARGLAKVIERLLKATHQTRIMILKTGRRLHIELLIKITMKENVVNVHLMQLQFLAVVIARNARMVALLATGANVSL